MYDGVLPACMSVHRLSGQLQFDPLSTMTCLNRQHSQDSIVLTPTCSAQSRNHGCKLNGEERITSGQVGKEVEDNSVYRSARVMKVARGGLRELLLHS